MSAPEVFRRLRGERLPGAAASASGRRPRSALPLPHQERETLQAQAQVQVALQVAVEVALQVALQVAVEVAVQVAVEVALQVAFQVSLHVRPGGAGGQEAGAARHRAPAGDQDGAGAGTGARGHGAAAGGRVPARVP